MNDIPKADAQIRIELAREAKNLLEDRAFSTAIVVLQKQWYGELIDASADAAKVQELTAKLRALEAIPALLRNLMQASQFAPRGANVR
jgi:hypothetical protein